MEKDGGIMIKKETVTKTDLLKVLDLMEASGIQYWLGCGRAGGETDQGAQGCGYQL